MKLNTFTIKEFSKRIVLLLFSLVGLSILIFLIARVIPGDPIKMMVGNRAPQWVVDQARQQFHLNEPIYAQYYYWLRDVFSGSLGQSFVTKRDVLVDITTYFPATMELIIWSVTLTLVISIVFGMVGGMKANSWVDNVLRLISYFGVSVPEFVFAVVGIYIFGWVLGVLPVQGRLSIGVQPPPTITGMYTFDALVTGHFFLFVDAVRHILLPTVATVAAGTAAMQRVTRSAVVENLRKDYIRQEVSHGLPDRKIMFKYLLKPSIIPLVSIVGLSVASYLSYLFIIETVFNWPGFARYGMQSFLNKDLNAIVGVCMVVGLIYALSNLIVDYIVYWIDPRIRIMQRSK